VPKAGSIKRIYVQTNLPSANAGSGENVTHAVCVNSNTYCFGSAAFAYNATSASGSDSSLNQPVNAGDTIAIKIQTPAWATKPTNVRWYAVIYIE
jgi:GH24 family phage-related lysozyme (muramidase)